MKGQLSVNPTFRPLSIKRAQINLQEPLVAYDGHHIHALGKQIDWGSKSIINCTYAPSLQVIMVLCSDWKLYAFNKDMDVIAKLSDWESKYSVGFQYVERLKTFILVGVTEIESLLVNIRTNLKETKFLSSVKFNIERLQLRAVLEKDRLSWNKGYGYNVEQNLLYVWSTTNIHFYSLNKLELKSAVQKIVKKQNAITYVHLNTTYKYTITGLINGNVKVWRVPLTSNSSKEYIMIHNCVHHTKTVEKIVPSTDERIIISSSLDLTVCLWSLQTFELLRVYNFQGDYSDVWLVDQRKAYAIQIQNTEIGELLFGKTMQFILQVDSNIMSFDKKLSIDGSKVDSFQITLESNVGIQICAKDLVKKDLNKIDISYFYPPLKAKSIKQIISSPYNMHIYYMLVENGEMFSVRIQNNSSKIEQSFSLQHTQDSENHSLNQTPTYLAFLPIEDINFDSQITDNNINSQSASKIKIKPLPTDQQKLITIGCSRGSIIILSLDSVQKFKTRLTYHRDSITNIQLIKDQKSNIYILASFCAENYLRFIALEEDKASCFLTIFTADTLKFYKSFQEKIAFAFSQGIFEIGKIQGPSQIIITRNLDSVDHQGEILSVDYDFQKKLIMTCGNDNRIKIWSVDKDLLYEIKLDEGVKYAIWSNHEEIFVLHRNKLLYLRNIRMQFKVFNSQMQNYLSMPIKQLFQQLKHPEEHKISSKDYNRASQYSYQHNIAQNASVIDSVPRKKGKSAHKMKQTNYYSLAKRDEQEKKNIQLVANLKATKRHLQQINAIKQITNQTLLPKIAPKNNDKFQQFINAKLISKKMLTRRDITLNRIIMKNLIKEQFSDKEDDIEGLKLQF